MVTVKIYRIFLSVTGLVQRRFFSKNTHRQSVQTTPLQATGVPANRDSKTSVLPDSRPTFFLKCSFRSTYYQASCTSINEALSNRYFQFPRHDFCSRRSIRGQIRHTNAAPVSNGSPTDAVCTWRTNFHGLFVRTSFEAKIKKCDPQTGYGEKFERQTGTE